jgi:tetratricopeptide (TPR) repeat protein
MKEGNSMTPFEIYVTKGNECFDSGDYQNAIYYAELAIGDCLDPMCACQLKGNIAWCKLRLGKVDEAFKILKETENEAIGLRVPRSRIAALLSHGITRYHMYVDLENYKEAANIVNMNKEILRKGISNLLSEDISYFSSRLDGHSNYLKRFQ